MVSSETLGGSDSLSTRFHSAKCSQPAVRLPTRLRLPLERMISALAQNSCGMVSL